MTVLVDEVDEVDRPVQIKLSAEVCSQGGSLRYQLVVSGDSPSRAHP